MAGVLATSSSSTDTMVMDFFTLTGAGEAILTIIMYSPLPITLLLEKRQEQTKRMIMVRLHGLV